MFNYGREMMQSGGQRVLESGGHHEPLQILCMVLGLILWALVVTTLVLLIIRLVRRLRNPCHSTVGPPAAASADPGALKILEERYARGEIDQADYQARKKDLTGLSS
jgi:putative membrane protein